MEKINSQADLIGVTPMTTLKNLIGRYELRK